MTPLVARIVNVLLALASYEVEATNRPSTLEMAEFLSELEPEHSDTEQMLSALRRQKR